jgi:lipopolysaccharide transport system permease protein
LIYVVIFGQLAEISSEGIPRPLFYLCGITCWNYFSDCLIKTSTTFTTNASIFGKVYFPRLVLPISIIFSNLIKFGVQFLLFLAFLIYYVFIEASVEPNLTLLIFPLLILLMGGLGLGIGIIISSLTTKYRDFNFLVSFGVQLLMYATPIVYPLSVAKEQLGSYSWILIINPMTSVVEAMKYAFLGQGEFNLFYLGYSLVFMLIVLFIGIGVFNKVEKTFMDSV